MIEYLVMDVDGTLTDGKIYMSNTGEAMKAFNIKDGCGIHEILPKYSIIPVIITGRESQIVSKRSKELGITNVYQGVHNKVMKLQEIICETNIVAYIGDDINDLDCMLFIKESGGIVGCPFDAAKEVKAIADYISPIRGGEGAVRDFIEYLISAF